METQMQTAEFLDRIAMLESRVAAAGE